MQSPKLADHRSNIARRANWNEKLQKHLQSIQHVNNCLIFEEIEDGPAPWPFYYKGQPTLQDKLVEAEQVTKWHRERAEGAERDLSVAKDENVELLGRLEALSAQLSAVLASRSWRLTRGLRVFGRLFRGEFDLVWSSIRQRFKRDL